MRVETQLRQESVTTQDADKPLTESQIQELSTEIFGWKVIDEDGMPHLRREFKFEDFANALRFTNAIGQAAEEQDHHPKLTTEWGLVTVEWWTHKLGGLHRNDFIMASKTNDIYERWREIIGEKDQLDEALEASFPASDPLAIGSRIE